LSHQTIKYARSGLLRHVSTEFRRIRRSHIVPKEAHICSFGPARPPTGIYPNYAERRRYGERVSTGFVESTVNTVVGKRFGKRQQMRWSKQGAHLMLQTRTLDGTLRQKFEQWYPGMNSANETPLAA
jgi:hypothetical protein